MTVTAATLENVKGYMRVTNTDDDILITAIMAAAKAYIIGYTGLTAAEVDTHEDITVAYLCLCSDMYDNRLTVIQGGTSLNKTIANILGMHATNQL